MANVAKIGLIEGRHPLPVEQYLLPANATDLYGFYQKLFEAAFDAAKAIEVKTVHLYITGLTIAALGAAKGFWSNEVELVVFSFDPVKKEYVPVTV